MRWHMIIVFGAFVLSSAACGQFDAVLCMLESEDTYNLNRPFYELKKRLDAYQDNGSPAPVYEWADEYHGEGPGYVMYHNLMEWGNDNTEDMNTLLRGWPPGSKEDIIDELLFAESQSDQKIRFDIPKRKDDG